jgi:hypothetical protein
MVLPLLGSARLARDFAQMQNRPAAKATTVRGGRASIHQRRITP